MWVKALSKHKFGELKEPFVNIDQIATVELGHDHNLNVKLSNGEEMVVSNDHARKLLQFIQEQSISEAPASADRVTAAAPAIH
jgi:hypothetical protein